MSKYILFYYNKGNWLLIEKNKNGIFNHHTVNGVMVFSFIRISKKSDIRTLERFYKSDDINVSLTFKTPLGERIGIKKDIVVNKEGYRLPQANKTKFTVIVPADQYNKIDKHFRGTQKLKKYTVKQLEKTGVLL